MNRGGELHQDVDDWPIECCLTLRRGRFFSSLLFVFGHSFDDSRRRARYFGE